MINSPVEVYLLNFNKFHCHPTKEMSTYIIHTSTQGDNEGFDENLMSPHNCDVKFRNFKSIFPQMVKRHLSIQLNRREKEKNDDYSLLMRKREKKGDEDPQDFPDTIQIVAYGQKQNGGSPFNDRINNLIIGGRTLARGGWGVEIFTRL